jgi:hypothetical protein
VSAKLIAALVWVAVAVGTSGVASAQVPFVDELKVGGLAHDVTLLGRHVKADFTPLDGIFINGSLGGALQDGYEDSAPPGRKRLGSPVLFRESVELGYQINPLISVSAFVDHISNANLAPRNAGITSVGGRVGFKF